MANSGQFRKGNQLWRNIDYPTQRKYEKPQDLFNKFIEYMNENDKKFWSKEEFIKSGPGAGTKVYLDTPNPPSLLSFCVYAGIVSSTFSKYCKIDAEWELVTSTIKETILSIQLDGATANIFNQNIVARITGLVDKKEITEKLDYSDDERRQMILDLLEEAKKSNNSMQNTDGSDLV